MTEVLLVDFDGTLTRRDTTLALVFALLARRPGRILWVAYGLLRVRLAAGFEKQRWKNRAIGALLEGSRPADLSAPFKRYRRSVRRDLRESLLTHLESRQATGAIVLIVTASPELAVAHAMAEFPFQVVGTRFQERSGVLASSVQGPVCYGDGKLLRIDEWRASEAPSEIVYSEAWTDAISDLPMMNLAQRRVWICPPRERDRISQACRGAEFYDLD